LSEIDEKPVIIFAQDNSSSILLSKDSSFYKKQYDSLINSFLAEISSDMEIVRYTFGNELNISETFDFTENSTDIDGLLTEIENLYLNRNVGALILASDGIFNRGNNPLYNNFQLNCPVHTIGLGDSVLSKDLIISGIEQNEFSFRNIPFPVRVKIEAHGLIGNTAILNVSFNDTIVETVNININENTFSSWIPVELKSEDSGVQHYVISVDPINEELNHTNNSRELLVDIIDDRQKILIIPFSPHPDIAALKKAIESNPKYDLTVGSSQIPPDSIIEYNLVILHQLPSKTKQSNNILKSLKENSIPTLYIIGSSSSISSINNLELGFTVQSTIESLEEARPIKNNEFGLFEMDEDYYELLQQLPPLLTFYGDYILNSSTDILFYQSIKQFETEKPLIFFNRSFNKNDGIIAGEGLWRWRMYDYLENGDFFIFDELINKIVQYLSVQINKDRFVLNVNNLINEYETVNFRAEFYNPSYEKINTPDINIEITDTQNNSFKFLFDRYSDSYFLNAGVYPVGDYSYTAKTEHKGENFIKQGEFSIRNINLESESLRADHPFLHELSNNNNGNFYQLNNLPKLVDDINTSENIMSKKISEKKFYDLINYKWIFIFILLLISMEWFLRKYFGTI